MTRHRGDAPKPARALTGILLKLCSVMLFITMSSLIKAVSDHVPPRRIGVLPVLLRHPGHSAVADPARGPAHRSQGARADGPRLARGRRHGGDGSGFRRAWPLAPARGDGADLCRTAPRGDLCRDVPR